MIITLYLMAFINLIYIAYIDIKTKKIYNKSLIYLLCLGLIYALFFSNDIFSSFLGFAFGAIFLMFIYICSRGGIGEGDIKLVAILGLFLGYHFTILLILIACILQIIFRIINLKKLSYEKTLPFAPAICLSAILLKYGTMILFLRFR